MLSTSTRKRTFTLIEVVIALIIFGVGVLVCLRAMVYFISIGDQVQRKAQATLLAKEALDIIYNQRDSNIRKGVKRNCAIIDTSRPDMCADYFSVGSQYIVGFDGDHNYKIQKLPNNEGDEISNAKLSLVEPGDNTVSYYTHTSNIGKNEIVTLPKNAFSRIVNFSQATMTAGKNLASDKVLKVTVKVYYLPDNTDRYVLLESLLSAGEKME